MNEEVNALRSELALVKHQFNQRLGAVEERLNSLLVQDGANTDYQSKVLTEQLQAVTKIDGSEALDQATPIQESNAQDRNAKESNAQKSDTQQTFNKVVVAGQNFSPSKKSEASSFAHPSFITVLLQTILSSFFTWFSPVTDAYQSYKERGMLGIFILTMVGIGLTLAGFGYLMQLLIDQLGAGSKSLLMCFAAISVMGVGIALKIKTKFGEFATAIVTLGILLSYSTVYFSGSVYHLLPNIAVLGLYLVIALACHALALWLDTKVVAALGIIGIATMPMLSSVINIEPLYYLLSLAFVVCSSLVLSYRKVGRWLAHLCLAFTLISLEWIIGVENIHLSAWLVNVFYLLFFTYVCISLLKENTAIKQTLVFLAALVGSAVLLFWQVTELFTLQISIVFAVNTFIAIAASALFYKGKRELTPFFILLAASWALLSIVSIFSTAYWGIGWALEGLLLLAIGRKYNFSASVNQGQVLTAIALVYAGSALAMYFPLPALHSIDGWVLSLTIVAIIATWQRLINNSEAFDPLTKTRIKPLLQLLEVIWIAVLVIVSADLWLGNWAGALVILIQLGLLCRAKNCRQKSIEIFAVILITIPFFYVYIGVMNVGSYRFMMLPLFAQCALVSAFAQLWLWSAFYRKYHVDSEMKKVSEAVRILFYMIIPIFWVASVIRRFDEAALMLLWLSPLLALVLARKVKHPLLVQEAKILTGLTSIFLILALDRLSLNQSVIALLGFSAYYATAYVLNRKESHHIYEFICSWGTVSFGFALPIFIGEQTGSFLYGVISAGLYWSSAFNLMRLSDHLKRNETFITVINLLLLVVAWILIQFKTSYALVPLIFLAAALYQKEHRFKTSKISEILKLNGDLFLHSIAAITYVSLLFSLEYYRLDLFIAPLLAVHGAMILFLKDRRLATVKYSFAIILLGIVKLALIDAANALLWQKVMLFMGIGIFILLASFWYQKISTNEELIAD
jgi:hypothetical protein